MNQVGNSPHTGNYQLDTYVAGLQSYLIMSYATIAAFGTGYVVLDAGPSKSPGTTTAAGKP